MEIIGHQKIINILDETMRNGKKSQAYIFSGPRGVGKFTVALSWSRAIVSGDGFSASTEEPSGNEMMDIHIVSPEKVEKKGVIKEKEISVDQVREAQGGLANFPYGGRYRVLVIDEADRMSLGAQNVLLKTMEEPNSSSIIILITDRLSRIIPTVRSRSRTVNFGLVPDSEIEKHCRSLAAASDISKIVRYSMGRPGMAQKMLDDKEQARWFDDSDRIFKKMSEGRINENIKLAGEMAKNVPEAVRHLEFWIWQIHSEGSPERAHLSEKISRGLDEIKNTQANTRIILENIFIE